MTQLIKSCQRDFSTYQKIIRFIMLIVVLLSSVGLTTQPSSSSASDRKFLKIYSGNGGFCGITEDESYTCVAFQAGFEKANLYIPTDLTGVSDVARTSYATCALLKTHKLRCWVDKRDDFKELGQPPADLGLVDKIYSRNDNFCVILRTHKVRCWTPNSVKAIEVNLPGKLERVKILAFGRESYCTLDFAGKITCYGQERWGGESDYDHLDDPYINPVPPKDFENVRDIQFIPGWLGYGYDLRDKYCAVDDQNKVVCWRNGSLVSPLLNQTMSQGTVYIDDSTLYGCSIAQSRELNCWYRHSFGDDFPTFLAGEVISVAFVHVDNSPFYICFVDVTFSYQCWLGNKKGPVPIPVKSNFPELQRPQNLKTDLKGNNATLSWDLLDTEFGVTNYKVVLSPGNFSCTTKTNSCQILGLIPGIKYDANMTVSNLDGFKRFGIAKGLISVPKANFGLDRCPTSSLDSGSWENLSGEPKLKGTFRPGSNITGFRGSWPSGTKLCSFWIRDGKVVEQNQDGIYQVKPTDLDKSVNYVVIGTDVNGNSLMRVSDSAPFHKLCTRPGIYLRNIPGNLIASRNTTIVGYITRCPFESLDSVIVRFKQAGESWSGITKFPTNLNQSFRISRKFPANTKVQIGVDLGWKKVWQPSWMVINIEELPARHEFSVTYSNLKTKSFNQGGILYYKFQSDKPFNGTCGAIANNDNAFNFALTYMGSESHLATFKVKNGYGTGSQQMRWNGVVGVTLVCTSEAFKTVTESSYVTLRSNF